MNLPVQTGNKEVFAIRPRVIAAFNFALNKLPFTDVYFDAQSPLQATVDEINEGHSVRVGYAIYERVASVDLGTQTWILALATRTRGYLADDVLFDLQAFLLSPDQLTSDSIQNAIQREINNGMRYLPHSILTGKLDSSEDEYRLQKNSRTRLDPQIETVRDALIQALR